MEIFRIVTASLVTIYFLLISPALAQKADEQGGPTGLTIQVEGSGGGIQNFKVDLIGDGSSNEIFLRSIGDSAPPYLRDVLRWEKTGKVEKIEWRNQTSQERSRDLASIMEKSQRDTAGVRIKFKDAQRAKIFTDFLKNQKGHYGLLFERKAANVQETASKTLEFELGEPKQRFKRTYSSKDIAISEADVYIVNNHKNNGDMQKLSGFLSYLQGKESEATFFATLSALWNKKSEGILDPRDAGVIQARVKNKQQASDQTRSPAEDEAGANTAR